MFVEERIMATAFNALRMAVNNKNGINFTSIKRFKKVQ